MAKSSIKFTNEVSDETTKKIKRFQNIHSKLNEIECFSTCLKFILVDVIGLKIVFNVLSWGVRVSRNRASVLFSWRKTVPEEE